MIAGLLKKIYDYLNKFTFDGSGNLNVTGGGGGGGNVTVINGAGAAAVNVQDGGNSLTVDATALPLPTGAATAAKQLADGHNVAVNNAAGASAVNIQDGGNSLTVDGSVNVGTVTTLPATPAGSNIIGKVGIDQTTPGTTNKVSIGTDGTVAVNTALPAGTNAIGKLAANAGVNVGTVDVATIPAITGTVTANKGDTNYTKVRKFATSADANEHTLWTPASGKKFVITDIIISSQALTTQIVNFRDNTAGSTILITSNLAGTTIPIPLQTPIQSTTANNVLTYQAGAANLNIFVSGYEI